MNRRLGISAALVMLVLVLSMSTQVGGSMARPSPPTQATAVRTDAMTLPLALESRPAIRGDASPDAVPDSAPSAVVTSVLLGESFEDGVMPPPEWSVINTHATKNWELTTDPSYVHSGSYAAWVDYDTPRASDEWLISSVVDLLMVPDGAVSFWGASNTEWCPGETGGANMLLHVTDVAGTVIDTLWDMCAEEEWEEFVYRQVTADLSAYVGMEVRLAWQYVGIDGQIFVLDDIVVSGTGGEPVVTLDPQAQNEMGNPSAVVQYELTLTNLTGQDDTFDISYSGHAWGVSGPATVGPVLSGDSETFVVAVTIPLEGVSCSDCDSVVVEAVAQGDPLVSDTASIETCVGNPWQDETNTDAEGKLWAAYTCTDAYGDAGTCFYVGGIGVGDVVSGSGQMYDIDSGTWSSFSSDAPTPVFGATLGYIDGKVYLAGGFTSLVDPWVGIYELQIYDLASGTWSYGPSMPPQPPITGAGGSNGDVLDGKLYVVGGCGDNACASNQTLEYDPDAEAWTAKTPIPYYYPVFHGAAAGGGKLYVAGEYWAGPDFAAYDPVSDTWEELPYLPASAGKQAPVMAFAPDCAGVFLYGGDLGDGSSPVASTWYWHPAIASWVEHGADLNVTTSGAGGGYAGSKLWSFAGMGGSWSSPPHESLVYCCPPSPPEAPALYEINNTDGDGEYFVDWSAVPGATSYALEEDEDGSFLSPEIVYSGSGIQHHVTGQEVGVWYYRVQASNHAGDSPYSNTQSVEVLPAAPVLYSISNADGDGTYEVDWSDVAGVTDYTLEEADNDSFTSATVYHTAKKSFYDVSGQGAGDWYYRVRATTGEGDSPWSNIELVGVIPGAPVLDPISDPDGDRTYLVNWSAAPGATKYTLQEDVDPGFGNPTVRYDGPLSEYTVTGQQGGLWYYRVVASNSGGDSPWSNTHSVGVVPAPPTLYTITNPGGDGNYLVDWSPVQGAAGYEVEEDADPAFTPPSHMYGVATDEYSISGQGPGDWYYRVRAWNSFGTGAWSNVELVGVIPEAPMLSEIENPDGDGDYTVVWSEVTGATSYKLQEAGNPSFTDAADLFSAPLLEYPVVGQGAGDWYYRVRASNAGGDSPWSNVELVGVIPGAPALNEIENPDGDGDYTVAWSQVPGATSYKLQEADNPSFTDAADLYSGPLLECPVVEKVTGVWYYRVLASNSGGDSPWSNVGLVGVFAGAPVLSEIENLDGDGDYTVAWSQVAGATSYKLVEADNPSFAGAADLYSGPLLEYPVVGQGAGDWYYRVRASNAGGDSPWSNVELVGVIPAAPMLSEIENLDGDGDYTVVWSEVTGATSYKLQEADNPSFTDAADLYSGPLLDCPVVEKGTGVWYYRVLASNSGGDSPWSNVGLVGVFAGAPVLSEIENLDGDGDYTVAWSQVAGATSYKLVEADNPSFTGAADLYSGPLLEYSVIGRQAGDWYYRVRASNSGGDSPWSSTRSVTVQAQKYIYLPLVLR